MSERDKINLAVPLEIKQFSGSGITSYESGVTNGLVQKIGSSLRITQRPSIDITVDAVAAGADGRGRGVYYWEQDTTLYFVDNDTIYKNDYSTPLVTPISAGTEKVYIFEGVNSSAAAVLVLLDPENNEAYTITTAGTVTQISDPQFPPTLVHGGAVLNGTLYVMEETGIIYNSDFESVDTWAADGLIDAERDTDKGVYLGKHHEGLVAIGTRTIEFFYDAANANGSPLNRRPDIFHNIGCADGLSVWENGDIIYFVGSDPNGVLGVWKIENFTVEKVSTDTIDSYINHNVTIEDIRVVGSGVTAQGHRIYLITLYLLSEDATPVISAERTLCFDSFSGLWGQWVTTINGNVHFPLIQWTKRTGGHNATASARAGEGIMANGDIITLGDNMRPLDTIAGFTGYFQTAADYLPTSYFEQASPDTNIPISFIIRTGMYTGGTTLRKRQDWIKPIHDETDDSYTLTLRWTTSTEQDDVLTTGRALDTSKQEFARQGGHFRRRNYQLEYAGNEQLYLEAMEVGVSLMDI